MTRLPILFVTSITLTLSACGPSGAPDKAAGTSVAQPEAPAIAAPTGKRWVSDMGGTGGRARLVYAEAGANDYGLKFECPSNGPVYVYPGVKPAAGATAFPFVLGTSSGNMPIDGGVYDGVVIAAVPSSSFANMRATGTVNIAEPSMAPVHMDASTPEERAFFDQFFKTCGT